MIGGHPVIQHGAVLGAVQVSSLRSAAAFRGASDLDGASARLRDIGSYVLAALLTAWTMLSRITRAHLATSFDRYRYIV